MRFTLMLAVACGLSALSACTYNEVPPQPAVVQAPPVIVQAPPPTVPQGTVVVTPKAY